MCCSYYIMLCGFFIMCCSRLIRFCGFFIMSCNVVLTCCVFIMLWCNNFIMWCGVLRSLTYSLCSCHDVMWLRCYVVWYLLYVVSSLRDVVLSLCLLGLTCMPSSSTQARIMYMYMFWVSQLTRALFSWFTGEWIEAILRWFSYLPAVITTHPYTSQVVPFSFIVTFWECESKTLVRHTCYLNNFSWGVKYI